MTPEIIIALTPLVSFAVTAGFKKILPQIPGWALPLVAAVVGIATDLLGAQTTGANAAPLTAAFLGLAATGLHQIKSQLNKPAE